MALPRHIARARERARLKETTAMQGIAILVPSRGRPAAAVELAYNWRDCTEGRSRLIIAVDDDDPQLPDYGLLAMLQHDTPGFGAFAYVTGPRKTMAAWTNHLAAMDWAGVGVDVLASLGDDHRLEPGFEGHVARALEELNGIGIVYGDDTHQGEGLATSAFLSRAIVDELGWMIPPALDHLYCDNAWLELGRAANCLRYVPELRIPHNHPAHEGKTFDEWDLTYREGTGEAVWEHDGKAFDNWRDNELLLDAAKVIGLRARTATPPALA